MWPVQLVTFFARYDMSEIFSSTTSNRAQDTNPETE